MSRIRKRMGLIMKTFGQILPHVHYTPRPAAYGIAVNARREVALIYTPRGYFLPGGGLEGSEDEHVGLKREFLEETGHDIDIIQYISSASLFDLAPRQQVYFEMIGHFYAVAIGEKVQESMEEDHELVWMDAAKAVEIMKLEHQAWAVKLWIEQG